MAQRITPRIVPPSPISVAVEQDGGSLLAYGLIADISGNGACVWTDAHLEVGSRLRFRISFAQPPEIHELVGTVVWDRPALPERGRKNNARCGVMWLGATALCAGLPKRKRFRRFARAIRSWLSGF